MTNSELVLNVKVESNYQDPERMGVAAAWSKSIFEGPDKLTYMTARKFQRRSKTGKIFSYWETQDMYSLRLSKHGKLLFVVGSGSGRRKKMRSATVEWDWIANGNRYGGGEEFQFFLNAAKEKFGIESAEDLFPIAKLYDIPASRIPRGLRGFFREKTIQDFTKAAFGKTRYRKDLVKAVARANPQVVALARQFRGLAPIDWIIAFLRLQHQTATVDLGDLGDVRTALLKMNRNDIRRLLAHTIRVRDTYQIKDTANFVNSGRVVTLPPLEGVRSWRDLHDKVYEHIYGPQVEYHRVGYDPIPQENFEIPLTEIAEKLDGALVGELVLTAAKDRDMMQQWSDYMSNCISSYARNAKVGLGEYLGVYEGDKLVANIEVRDGELKQLLGKHNQPLKEDRRKIIEGVLVENKIKVPKHYWGSND